MCAEMCVCISCVCIYVCSQVTTVETKSFFFSQCLKLNFYSFYESQKFTYTKITPQHNSPRTKANNLVKMLECVIIFTRSVFTSIFTGWKATLPGRSHYSKRNIKKKPDYSLQMHTRRKTLIYGDMSCRLTKLKWNFLAIMTIFIYGLNWGTLASLRTPSPLWNMRLPVVLVHLAK